VSGPSAGLRIYIDGESTGKVTPDRVIVRAGAHVISVRRPDGSEVDSRRVIVDPSKSENAAVAFK